MKKMHYFNKTWAMPMKKHKNMLSDLLFAALKGSMEKFTCFFAGRFMYIIQYMYAYDDTIMDKTIED